MTGKIWPHRSFLFQIFPVPFFYLKRQLSCASIGPGRGGRLALCGRMVGGRSKSPSLLSLDARKKYTPPGPTRSVLLHLW